MWIGMHVDGCAVSMHCNWYVAAVLGEIAAAKGPDAGSAVTGESDDEASRNPELASTPPFAHARRTSSR